MKFVLALLVMAASAGAAEYAILASGARMRVDRHETVEGKVRLYSGPGFIEVEPAQITGFEAEEAVPPAPAAAPAPPVAPAPAHPRELIDRAAEKYGLPKELLHSVVKQESGYRTGAVSPKGAIGLMQLMPGTARALGADPHDPAQNVDAGARYLSHLLKTYDGYLWHALAAYNAGPGAVKKYGGNIPPYRETREYIRRIAADLPPQSSAASN